MKGRNKNSNKCVHNCCYGIIFVVIFLTTITSCNHTPPSKPIVEYDADYSKIQIIQTDTAAHDSAFVSIDKVYQGVFPIKDTITICVQEIIKKLNQVEIAYKLATQDKVFNVSVHTTRTNDTTFQYRYQEFEIMPIKVAEVLSGQCLGLYDVNYKRDYHDKIRQWMFKNDITPDSSLIENTNSILCQFNYSGKNEYSALKGSVPVVTNLNGLKFKFNVNLSGDYFYLYAYACKSGTPIKSFVESKITKGLTDACHSIYNEFSCSNSGNSGPNVLFLVGIDKNWKYEALPVGIVIIDDIAPSIVPRGHLPTQYRNMFDYSNYDNSSSSSWPKSVTLKSQNMLVNIPNISSISSSVTISYGNFEGDDYFGYNIPFYISIYGDVKLITIGSHKLNGNSIKNGECIRLHIRGLHTGDNSLPLTAVDSRGNRSTNSLSIPLVRIRNTPSYHDDNDYDDLEDRVSDLESRMDDLE